MRPHSRHPGGSSERSPDVNDRAHDQNPRARTLVRY